MELYEHQEKAFGLLTETDKNLLIIAPTGAGKTEVGYEALRQAGEGVYVAPTRALCYEKYHELRAMFPDQRVALGNKDYSLGQRTFRGSAIRVITHFKLNQFLQNEWFSGKVPVVVFDEVHNLPPEFEIIITKLKEMHPEVRLIGLSATVSDEDEARFAGWLDAIVVKSEERPVPIIERVVFFDVDLDDEGEELIIVKVYENGHLVSYKTMVGSLEKNTHIEILHQLIREQDQAPALWFSPYRARAAQIAHTLSELGDGYDHILDERARALPGKASEYSSRLKEVMPSKCAFHHGGLSIQERELIFELAQAGKLQEIVSCFTLVQGVNLPARHVVLDTIYDYGNKGSGSAKRLLDVSMFRQLQGRAGRPQFDTIGYSWISVFSEIELAEVQEVLLKYKASKLESRIMQEYFLTATLPQLVQFGFDTAEKIAGFIRATYWGSCMQDAFPLMDQLQRVVSCLIDQKVFKAESGQLKLTFAGEQIARLSIHPDEYFVIDGLVNKTSLDYAEWVEKMVRVTADYVLGIEASDRLKTCLEELRTYGFAVFTAECKHYTRDMADYLSRLLDITRSYFRLNYRMDDYQSQWERDVARQFTYGSLQLAVKLAPVLRRDQLKRLIRNLGPALTEDMIADKNDQRAVANLLFSHAHTMPNGTATKVAEIIGADTVAFQAMVAEEMAKIQKTQKEVT